MKIVKAPNSILSNKTRKVTIFDNDLKKLADAMVLTMHKASGIGLAANQINKDLNIMAIHMDSEKTKIPLTVVVNPRLVSISLEMKDHIEGCLSLPGLEVDVPRATALKIKGQNLKGKPITIAAKGMFARIIQHEMDHLNGFLITDRGKIVKHR